MSDCVACGHPISGHDGSGLGLCECGCDGHPDNKPPQPAFYLPLDAGSRPWGKEELVALVPGVATCKLLHVKAGHKGRLQRHHRKDEAGHVLGGEMLVRWAEGDTLQEQLIRAGQSYHFPVGCIHQEEAVTDCVVVEVSTPFGNDREGCEERFGLDIPQDALPSTEPDDVTMWSAWW